MSKVAIIVETRKHKALPFVLNNVMSILPDEWSLQIFHGTDNLDFILDETYTDKIKELGVIKGSLFQFIFGDIEDSIKKNPSREK